MPLIIKKTVCEKVLWTESVTSLGSAAVVWPEPRGKEGRALNPRA